jgi:hypothetical protein
MNVQCCIVEIGTETPLRPHRPIEWQILSNWRLGSNPELMAAIDQDRLGLREWLNDISDTTWQLAEVAFSRKTFAISELPLYFEQYGIAYGSLLSSLRCLVDRKIRVLTYQIEE